MEKNIRRGVAGARTVGGHQPLCVISLISTLLMTLLN